MYPDSTLWIKDFTKFRNTLKGSTPFFSPSFNLIVIVAYDIYFVCCTAYTFQTRYLFQQCIVFNFYEYYAI